MPDLWMDVDATLAEVPVNVLALIDDTDFKTREESVAYNQAGLDLVWNFVTPAGAVTQTAVTPTTGGGDYDWTSQGNGIYTIGIPASGGASINNDTEGFGWFSGYATGVLPWRGPTIGFRASGLNDALIESAYSATRGLAGTALPAAAADAAGGLAISDTGGLDLDTLLGRLDAAITTRSSHSADDVWAVASRVLTAGTNLNDITAADVWAATTRTLSANTNLNDPTAAAIADAICDEILSGHTTAGSLAKAISDILADTNELQTDDVPGLIAALNDLAASDVLTTQLTESYAANGAAPTLVQAIFAIHQVLMAIVYSGTSASVKKLDGTTEAFAATLDDGTNPTQIIRS